MLSRLLRYADKVFGLPEKIRELTDSRPRIPASAVWAGAMAMFALRCASLRAVAAHLKAPGRLDRMTGPVKPSDDTMGRVFALIDPDRVRATLTHVVRRLGRLKALESPWPLRVLAIDGHEFFRFAPPPLPGLLRANDQGRATGSDRVLSPRRRLPSGGFGSAGPGGPGADRSGGGRARRGQAPA